MLLINFYFVFAPQGCLPLVLMFDIKEDIEVEPQCITALMEQLDVFISIKPKPKQPSKVWHQAYTHTAGKAFRGFLAMLMVWLKGWMLVGHLDCHTIFLTDIWWISMTFCTGIHVSLRRYYNNFGDALAFHLASSSVHYINLSNIYLFHVYFHREKNITAMPQRTEFIA